MASLLRFLRRIIAPSSVKELTYCEKLYKEITEYKTKLNEITEKNLSIEERLNWVVVHPNFDLLFEFDENRISEYYKLQRTISITAQQLIEIRKSTNLKIINRLMEEIDKIDFPDDQTENLCIYGLFHFLGEKDNYEILIKIYPQYRIVIDHDDFNCDSRFITGLNKLKSSELNEQFKKFAIHGLNYKFYCFVEY